MNIKINLKNKVLFFDLNIRDKRQIETFGYTNRCEDGRYIIFLDYDRIELKWIEGELKFLQDTFQLSDFYIFKSGEDNYHAICFDKVALYKYLNILKNSTVDINYINVPLHFGKKIWVLRMSDKNDIPVEYVRKISSPFNKHTQSKAHAKFISKMFHINITLRFSDDIMKMVMARYKI